MRAVSWFAYAALAGGILGISLIELGRGEAMIVPNEANASAVSGPALMDIVWDGMLATLTYLHDERYVRVCQIDIAIGATGARRFGL